MLIESLSFHIVLNGLPICSQFDTNPINVLGMTTITPLQKYLIRAGIMEKFFLNFMIFYAINYLQFAINCKEHSDTVLFTYFPHKETVKY